MDNLIIRKSIQPELLTLRAVTASEKIPALVEKRMGKITLISEEKIYYLYLEKKDENYNFHFLYDFFVNFSTNNKNSLNIEIDSFVATQLPEELVIQAISEGILFGSHKTINYKS